MGLVDLIFPVPCVACGRPGASLCEGCTAGLQPAPPFPVPAGLDSCVALLQFAGVGRQVVTGLKYRNNRSGLGRLTGSLVDLVGQWHFDCVTWAPTTATHRRQRGFDQAELLARRVARHLGVPCRSLLARNPGAGQTGRSASERRSPTGFRSISTVAPATVLLVDDVVTTGATMTSAGIALRAAGAHHVHGLALAHTPLTD